VPQLNNYLENQLKLQIHPEKLFIKTLSSGIDFLGWVHFPHHRILRPTTKRRLYKHIIDSPYEETRQSYLGLLKYGETYKVIAELERRFFLSVNKKPPRV